MEKRTVILAIESSCDDTSSAVIVDGILRSNVIASQKVHEEYGGVVPELASRAHQQNILPVVDTALKRAGVTKNDISAVAFTRGPGLLGSLLVGTSFAKGLALSLNVPLIDVNHLQGHVLAHFVEDGTGLKHPSFPFLCLLVSGGNSQIVLVKAYNDMQIIGQTIDDAAGEAFDKCAKVLGLPYPGGPWIDKLAKLGDPAKYPLQYLLMKAQNQADFLIKNSSVIGVEATKILRDLPGTSLRMSLVVFIVVPIAFAYPFFQRYIISGLTIGSVKG